MGTTCSQRSFKDGRQCPVEAGKQSHYLNARSYNSHLNYSKEMDQCNTSKVTEANDGVLKVVLSIIYSYIGSGDLY